MTENGERKTHETLKNEEQKVKGKKKRKSIFSSLQVLEIPFKWFSLSIICLDALKHFT